MTRPSLLDRFGNPVRRAELRTEAAAPTLTGVRAPISGYPADGLTPVRLAAILRAADHGDPVRYLELAEAIEERDLHYLGVLGTRRRAVSQIEVSVEAASDAPEDVRRADLVREWLRRDELSEELFHILDCIGKGVSFTEILWDTSEGQWWPRRLEWRDPRWFRFDRADLATPRMLEANGVEVPLRPFSFVFATIAAKSGLPLRSGLARAAAWAWMFKAYTQRDWAIFVQTYGQPLRLGKYGPEASEQDRDTLFRAVANIAGDCAAIIPEAMQIEFVTADGAAASMDLYERRADWLDRQVSKAVLGQTTSTDAISGGHAVAREHRLVQEDIERADARALAAILNRDLVRPWMDLEFGPAPRYPRLVIARPEREDLAQLAASLGTLVPLGLEVEQSVVRDRFGLPEPAPGARILGRPAAPAEPDAAADDLKGVGAFFKRGPAAPGIAATLQAQGRPAALPEPPAPDRILAETMAREAEGPVGGWIERIEAMLAAAGSLEEFREMLLAAYPALDGAALTERLAEGLLAAHLAGRVAVEEAAGGDG
ncbi:MAG: DUF935 domain-containing protein [Alphaproteobacteria bacterium]